MARFFSRKVFGFGATGGARFEEEVDSMPNPFPGMNPYLEEQSGWQGLHNMLIAQMAQALNAVLPPDYVASTEVRCLISRSPHEIAPDVVLRESWPVASPRSAGGVAVLDPPEAVLPPAMDAFDTPLVLRLEPLEERQAFINIVRIVRGKFRDAEVITTIEVLSPTNKNTRDDGYETYRRKQQTVLSSRANLLEIDLLRAGTHSVAVPEAALPKERAWLYLVCLHRGSRPFEYAVWLNALSAPLPRVQVPLAAGDPPVVLDLQAVLNLSYDAGAYDRQIDYAQEADPPLQGDDALWADALLRERSLRS